jgi:hypothetical protein
VILVWTSGCIPEANAIVNEVCIVKEIGSEVLEQTNFFSNTIVDGSKGKQRTASYRNAFHLLDDDVSKLEDIIFE